MKFEKPIMSIAMFKDENVVTLSANALKNILQDSNGSLTLDDKHGSEIQVVSAFF